MNTTMYTISNRSISIPVHDFVNVCEKRFVINQYVFVIMKSALAIKNKIVNTILIKIINLLFAMSLPSFLIEIFFDLWLVF